MTTTHQPMRVCEKCARSLPACPHCGRLDHGSHDYAACEARMAALDWPERLVLQAKARLGLATA